MKTPPKKEMQRVIVRTIASMWLALLLPLANLMAAPSWTMQPVPLATRWATQVEPENVWPEYPRPQMVRPRWQNLNGLWEYAITPSTASTPERYQGHILVPYPVESALSGVRKPLQPDQLLWYRRMLNVAPGAAGERVLLHFGAVDFEATVYMNGTQLGSHRGGYQSFSFDITDALRAGNNELVVKVNDPTEHGPNPQGKQHVNAQWMYYSASSGIWQTVWIERVPATHIEALKLTPNVDRSELRVEVALKGQNQRHTIEAIARSGQKVVAKAVIGNGGVLRIDQPRLWSPDDPYLYDLELRVLQGAKVVDKVQSYFGMRKIELKADEQGRARIHLNGKYTFNLGVVDQGFWPEGHYTAPTDAALKFDVQLAKALGFNTVRKHIKVEPQRWYYHCDRIGLLVWQDMPSSNNDSPQARVQFESEIRTNLAQLHNHPSITTWVLFNEGWGAYDLNRLTQAMKQFDPSRLVNGHSGPYDQLMHAQWIKTLQPSQLLWPLGGPPPSFEEFQALQYAAKDDWIAGDMVDLHYYGGPKMFPARADVASVTGEFGSFGVYIEGHEWDEFKPVGMGLGGARLSPPELLQKYAQAAAKLKELEAQGLSGATYFEIVDVEMEQQGFVTYDRAVAKLPIAQIERINAALVPRAKNYEQATDGVVVSIADPTAEAERYAQRLAKFRAGERDQTFLKRLAMMAVRQKDSTHATKVGDAFVQQAVRPYTKETWQVIQAVAYSTQDEAFKLLLGRTAEANAVLGEGEAQKKIVEILQRDVVTPYYQDANRTRDWNAFEADVAAKYGELGRETVYGARMMEALVKSDWTTFGRFYQRYYATAASRSPWPVHTLAHQVLLHVTDLQVLESAVRVMHWQLDVPRESPIFGRYDPTELDTYANLLYKAGRLPEAVEWQQKAVALADGRDPQMEARLEKMRSSLTSSLSSH
jgi:hypothetical protein